MPLLLEILVEIHVAYMHMYMNCITCNDARVRRYTKGIFKVHIVISFNPLPIYFDIFLDFCSLLKYPSFKHILMQIYKKRTIVLEEFIKQENKEWERLYDTEIWTSNNKLGNSNGRIYSWLCSQYPVSRTLSCFRCCCWFHYY